MCALVSDVTTQLMHYNTIDDGQYVKGYLSLDIATSNLT